MCTFQVQVTGVHDMVIREGRGQGQRGGRMVPIVMGTPARHASPLSVDPILCGGPSPGKRGSEPRCASKLYLSRTGVFLALYADTKVDPCARWSSMGWDWAGLEVPLPCIGSAVRGKRRAVHHWQRSKLAPQYSYFCGAFLPKLHLRSALVK